MDERINYLNEYCDLHIEWHRTGVHIDTATEAQCEKIKILRERALEQTGLTHNELDLIAICRKHNIFNRVNTFAFSQIVR